MNTRIVLILAQALRRVKAHLNAVHLNAAVIFSGFMMLLMLSSSQTAPSVTPLSDDIITYLMTDDVLSDSLVPVSGGRYVDLAQSDFPEALIFLSERGLLQGYPNGEIRPKDLISRAELVTLIIRELALNSNLETCFSDVQVNDWHAPFVCEAVRMGIVSGYGGAGAGMTERFRPDRPASYAEAIKMVSEAFGLMSAELSLTANLAGSGELTPDSADANDWFIPYANFSERNNLVPDIDYLPGDLITRDVTAELVKRAILLGSNPQARRSSGCSLVRQPIEQVNINMNGIQREFFDVLPASYEADVPHALVFAFHANDEDSSGRTLRQQLELEQHLNQAIIVYPEGQRDGPRNLWSNPDDDSSELRDYALYDALYDLYTSRYCVDLGKVYVVGVGMGAWFANSLACARADSIRAVASISGSISQSDCPSRVAALLMHNPDNGRVPLRDVLTARDYLLAQNVLEDTPQPSSPEGYNCERYGDTGMRYPLVWCAYEQEPNSPVPAGIGLAMTEFFETLP
ncbi:MAG: S-layer homology domain-containing protein [Deinococcota bacterium]